MKSRSDLRTYLQRLRLPVLMTAVVILLVLVYVAFEYGRYRAGYDVRAGLAARLRLAARIHELERSEREQRVQVAALESAKVGQTRERQEVSRTIGELQAQVARQAQELAFYRGVVGDSGQSPVTVQQFRVVVGSKPRRFTLRLVLGRPVRPEDFVTGTLGVTLEGSQGLAPATRDLAQVTVDHKSELTFNFRYLQPIECDLELPAGFMPERVTVELRPARRAGEPYRQTFRWSPETA
jgi:hypothetical protein